MARTLATLLLLLSGFNSMRGQTTRMEIVESIPLETVLDNPDIRNTTDVWLEMIHRARTSLEIEQFYVSPQAGEPLDTILAAIDNAAARGVSVRLLVDSRMYRTYPGTVDRYRSTERAGTSASPVQARVLDFRKVAGGIQHAKFFIVDGEEIFIGSQNFDWRALNHIHELGIRIRHADAVRAYRQVFEYDWNVAADSAPSPPPFPHHGIPELPFTIIDAPGDTIRFVPTMSPSPFIPDTLLWDEPQVARLLASARHEIDLQYLSYSAIGRDKRYFEALDGSLRRAAARGVQVHLIVSDWEKGSPGDSTIKDLAKVGNITVKFSSIPDWSGGYIPFGRVEHCKYIVVDGARFWLGTSNGERSYFTTSRNLGVIVEHGGLARRMKEIFDKGWNGPYVETVDPGMTYTPRKHDDR